MHEKYLDGFDPTRCALLAMDFQTSIIQAIGDCAPLLKSTGMAMKAVRRAGGKVAYVRVAFRPEEVQAFPSHSAMGARIRAAGSRMLADSPATTILEDIAPLPGDIVVRKKRVGSFSTTGLHFALKEAGIETLALAGVHTSGVILSTAREAHDLDYRVVVLSDCCADPDTNMHEFLLDRIFPKQAAVWSAMQFADLLALHQAST